MAGLQTMPLSNVSIITIALLILGLISFQNIVLQDAHQSHYILVMMDQLLAFQSVHQILISMVIM